MPDKQQHKLFLALLERSVKLGEQDDFFWREHPWYENPYYPKPWSEPITKPEWEKEKALLKAKELKVYEEMDKLYNEMYPESEYPEMHKYKKEIPGQQGLLDNPEPQVFDPLPSPPTPLIDKDKILLEGEELVKAAEEIFGVKATSMSDRDRYYHEKAMEKNALVYTVNNGRVNVLVERKASIPDNLSDAGKSILAKFNSL
jgi:hypothetical protein